MKTQSHIISEKKPISSPQNSSDGSLEVQNEERISDPADFLELRIKTLRDRIGFRKEPYNQDSLCYETAYYLAEPGTHELSDYCQQPMNSDKYPNSKKRNEKTNKDIYQKSGLERNDPSLFFLKTDRNATKIYEEYYSSRSLFLLCGMRPLVTSPKVYLTKKDNQPHILSEFIVSNSEQSEKYEYKDIPMFPYLAAIMLCKNERDINSHNYLRKTKISVTKGGIESQIPIAVRIDHGSESRNNKYNPFLNIADIKQSVESLFTLTSVFENDVKSKDDSPLTYESISWDRYQATLNRTNLFAHIVRDEKGMMKIKDELNYILFMRGMCDFIDIPKELLEICYLQDDKGTKLPRKLMTDFLETQDQAKQFFAQEIERFEFMIQQEPWKNLGAEYLATIPFEQILSNYHEVCSEFKYKNALENREVELPSASLKTAGLKQEVLLMPSIADVSIDTLDEENEEFKAQEMKLGIAQDITPKKRAVDLEEHQLWTEKVQRMESKKNSTPYKEV